MPFGVRVLKLEVVTVEVFCNNLGGHVARKVSEISVQLMLVCFQQQGPYSFHIFIYLLVSLAFSILNRGHIALNLENH
jgi:hypothetical protein